MYAVLHSTLMYIFVVLVCLNIASISSFPVISVSLFFLRLPIIVCQCPSLSTCQGRTWEQLRTCLGRAWEDEAGELEKLNVACRVNFRVSLLCPTIEATTSDSLPTFVLFARMHHQTDTA